MSMKTEPPKTALDFGDEPIDEGTRVILDYTSGAYAGAAGVATEKNLIEELWRVELDEPAGLFGKYAIISTKRLIRSPYQGEEIVSIDGHD